MPIAILWPTFALALLILVVWAMMNYKRFRHFHNNMPGKDELTDSDMPLSYPTQASANFRTLCELPPLYFALVPLLLVTHRGGERVEVVLAWTFVVLRFAQSFFHIRTKAWSASGIAMMTSTIALAAMWVTFFVSMLSAGTLPNI